MRSASMVKELITICEPTIVGLQLNPQPQSHLVFFNVERLGQSLDARMKPTTGDSLSHF